MKTFNAGAIYGRIKGKPALRGLLQKFFISHIFTHEHSGRLFMEALVGYVQGVVISLSKSIPYIRALGKDLFRQVSFFS